MDARTLLEDKQSRAARVARRREWQSCMGRDGGINKRARPTRRAALTSACAPVREPASREGAPSSCAACVPWPGACAANKLPPMWRHTHGAA